MSFCIRLLSICLLFIKAAAVLAEDKPDATDLIFIDNGIIKVGIKKSSGAGIAWISESGSSKNLIDHYDRGRLVQQSYYGQPDGSMWDKQPWRWNPVQGGDWKGNPATVLDLKHGKDWLESKTQPKHWASGQDITDMTMNQRIELDGALVKISFSMHYTGTILHPATHQEIPAVFVPAAYDTLVLYDGKKPWTNGPLSSSKPGWPNESRTPSEKWAAYVDASGQGIGVCVPVMEQITCYRFAADSDNPSACSYLAPLVTFAITPGMIFQYDCFITLGKTEQIRERFNSLTESLKTEEQKAIKD